MRSVCVWFSVVAMAMLTGCAGVPPKAESASIPSIMKPDTNTTRMCFVAGKTMTCIARTNMVGGGKRIILTTIPLDK